MSLFNIYTEHFKLSREKKVNQKKKKFLLRSDADGARWKESGNPVPAVCRSDVQGVGGANEGLGRGRALSLSLGTGAVPAA